MISQIKETKLNVNGILFTKVSFSKKTWNIQDLAVIFGRSKNGVLDFGVSRGIIVRKGREIRKISTRHGTHEKWKKLFIFLERKSTLFVGLA
jgi:hypothetical protein